MKLLIHEYYASGMGGAGALAGEGFAMLGALLRDFIRIPELEVLTVLGEGVMEGAAPELPLEGVAILRGDGTDESLREALAACDCVLFVAPETGGALARLTGMAEGLGKRVIGSSASAVALAGDKAAALRLLEEGGLPVPRWEFLNRAAHPAGFAFPFVVKPARGAGGEGVRLIRSPGEWESRRAAPREAEEAFLVQELVQGEAASVSCLVRDGGAVPLSLNRQHIGAGAEPVFLGITTPYGHRWADAAEDLAVRACSLVPGLRGFVGVDFIMGPRGPVVLEINPRVTFAYAALRRVAPQNLAREILACSEGERCPRRPEIRGSCTCLTEREGPLRGSRRS